jgi:hypothetical protein
MMTYLSQLTPAAEDLKIMMTYFSQLTPAAEDLKKMGQDNLRNEEKNKEVAEDETYAKTDNVFQTIGKIAVIVISKSFDISEGLASRILSSVKFEVDIRNKKLEEQGVDYLTIYDVAEMITEITIKSVEIFDRYPEHNKPVYRAFFRCFVFEPTLKRFNLKFTLSKNTEEKIFESFCDELSKAMHFAKFDFSQFKT